MFVDYDGNAVFKNNMYTSIHCVIKEIMTHFDESSNFNVVFSKYRRCGRLSCLGCACKVPCISTFYRVAIGRQNKSQVAFGCSMNDVAC